MGVISVDQITGYHFEDGEVVCLECGTDEERANALEDELLTEDQTESDDIYFCDRCKKRF